MKTVVLWSSASTVDQPWALLEEALSKFEPDFKLQRDQPDEQKVMPSGVEAPACPNLKQLLLADTARIEWLVPVRGVAQRRLLALF